MATDEKREVAVKAGKAPEKAVARMASPFEEFERFFDQIAPRMWLRSTLWPRPMAGAPREADLWAPSVDVIERDKELVVKAQLPGVNKEDIHISVSGNVMSIKGETKREEKEEKGDYFRCEISRGAFSRMLTLPADVDEGNARAELRDGVLIVTLPKREQEKKTDIKVE